jgi:cell division protein FtsB
MDELKQDNTRLKAELKKLNDDKNRLEEESKEQ